MKVNLISFSGWQDALNTLFISRGNWNEDISNKIHKYTTACTDSFGRLNIDSLFLTDQEKKEFKSWLDSLFRYGKMHITMLRFLDACFVVSGLHRGGQDDFDAHAKRFDNRIIRLSTRIAAMKDTIPETMDLPVSDFYKDKILTLGQVCKILGYELPENVLFEGQLYSRSLNGYVVQDMKDDPNVKRGLYNLGLSSTFIFKVNMCEYPHVRDLRSRHDGIHKQRGHAHPELWDLMDMLDKELYDVSSYFGPDLFDNVVQ
jgi:hypothetical protein